MYFPKVYDYSTYNVEGYSAYSYNNNNSEENEETTNTNDDNDGTTYSAYGASVSSSASYGSPYSEEDENDSSDGSGNGNGNGDGEVDDAASSTPQKSSYDEPEQHPIRKLGTSVNSNGKGKLSGGVEKKDWNKEFQILVEQVDSELKFKKLSHLSRDFVHAAQSYAIIIINELCLPYEEKTVKVCT